MKIARSGVIINTEHYDACVRFYADTFQLTKIFEESEGDFRLTCFDIAGTYLMIETGGVARPAGKSMAESATKLRLNVPDIHVTAKELEAQGIRANILKNDWGSTINIFDPDGNRIGLRDEQTFVAQQNRYSK